MCKKKQKKFIWLPIRKKAIMPSILWVSPYKFRSRDQRSAFSQIHPYVYNDIDAFYVYVYIIGLHTDTTSMSVFQRTFLMPHESRATLAARSTFALAPESMQPSAKMPRLFLGFPTVPQRYVQSLRIVLWPFIPSWAVLCTAGWWLYLSNTLTTSTLQRGSRFSQKSRFFVLPRLQIFN